MSETNESANRCKVQVPLNHKSLCVGGQPLFACTDGQLVSTQRSEGHIFAHDGDAVQGVTHFVSGLRLGLFGLRPRRY